MTFSGFDPAALDLLRELPSYDKAQHIARLRKKHRRHEFGLAGDAVKRVPNPWNENHPRADLLRLIGFQVRSREMLPKLVAKPEFAAWCEKRLRDLLPVHHWLVAHLGSEESS